RFIVVLGPFCAIFVTLFQGFGFVGNRPSPLQYAFPGWNRKNRAILPGLRQRRHTVSFQIPVRAVDRLPDAVEIRVTCDKCRARGRLRWLWCGCRLWLALLRCQLKLSGAGGKNYCRNCDRADESNSHSLDSPKLDESLRSISKLRSRSNCYVSVFRFAIMRVSRRLS